MGKFDYSINFEKSLTEFGSSHNRWVGNWNAQRAFFLFKEHSELLDYSAHNFYADMDTFHMYLVTTTPTTEMAKLIKSLGLCSKAAWVPQVTFGNQSNLRFLKFLSYKIVCFSAWQ